MTREIKIIYYKKADHVQRAHQNHTFIHVVLLIKIYEG